MPSRLIAFALAAIVAMPVVVRAASLPSPWVGTPEIARVAPAADTDQPGLLEPSGPRALLDSSLELGGLEEPGQVAAAVPGHAIATTYSYLAQRRTAAGLPPFVLGPSGPRDFPLRDQLHGPGAITYAIVEDPARRRGSDPLPAAAIMLALTLSGLAALACWWQHRHWL